MAETDWDASAFAPYPGRPEIRTFMCLIYDRSIDRSQIGLAVSRDGHSFHFVPGDAAIEGDPADPQSGFFGAYPSLVRTPDGRMIVFYDAGKVPHKFPRHRFGGSTQYAAVWAADMALAIWRDLGALASTVAQWYRAYWPSGKPMRSMAKKVDTARLRAAGAAMPMSSEAKITIRRAINLGSSPACSIRAM